MVLQPLLGFVRGLQTSHSSGWFGESEKLQQDTAAPTEICLSSLSLAQREVCSPLLCTWVALSSPVCSSDKNHQETLPPRRAVALDCDMFLIPSPFLLASVISWSLFKLAYFSNLSPSPLCNIIVIMSFSSPFLTFPYAS